MCIAIFKNFVIILTVMRLPNGIPGLITPRALRRRANRIEGLVKGVREGTIIPGFGRAYWVIPAYQNHKLKKAQEMRKRADELDGSNHSGSPES